MGCFIFQLCLPEKSVSLNSTVEIFDSDHQTRNVKAHDVNITVNRNSSDQFLSIKLSVPC